MSTTWYKVLRAGQSFHGGSLAWSLPVDGKPGEWHEVDGAPSNCSRGLHLTREPIAWFPGPDVKVFEAEGEDAAPNGDDNKTAFRRARLIRELSADELMPLGIFLDRDGTVPAGKTAVVWGKSKVTAWGDSQVTAWGNSQVTAWENSQVTARGNSQVTARENSQVTAWENSQVTADDRSVVTKSHSDCSLGCCTSKATVKLDGNAVLVDQSGDAPKVTTAVGELAPTTKAKKPKAAKKKPAKKARKAVRK